MKINGKSQLIAIAFICLAFINGKISHAEEESLRAVYFPLPPYTFEQAGTPAGGAIDYFHMITKEMGIKNVILKNIPLRRILYFLEEGEWDLTILLLKTPEREAKFAYPKKEYGFLQPAIAVRQSHPLQTIESVNDLLPLTIGYLGGGSRPGYLNDSRLQYEVLSGQNQITQHLKKLIINRIDAFLLDRYSIILEAKKIGLDAEIRIIPVVGTQQALYSVFSKKSEKKYLAAYESALERVQSHHSFDDVFNAFLEKQDYTEEEGR